MQCGDIPGYPATDALYTEKMPPRYIHASEVGTFASCRRAWFLERQNQLMGISEATEEGAHSAGPEHVARNSPFTARLSLVLLVLGIGGIACAALFASMRP